MNESKGWMDGESMGQIQDDEEGTEEKDYSRKYLIVVERRGGENLSHYWSKELESLMKMQGLRKRERGRKGFVLMRGEGQVMGK